MKKMLKKTIAVTAAAAMSAGILPTASFAEDMSKSNIILDMNFDNYSEGSTINGKVSNGEIKVEYATDGNSVLTAVDSKSNSMAVKMVHGAQNINRLNMYYTLDSIISTGKYKISYDSRIENAVGNFSSLGSLQKDTTWSSIFNPRVYGNTGLFNGQADWIDDYKGKIGYEYAHHEIVADFDAKKITYTIKGGTANKTVTYETNTDNWRHLSFNLGPIDNVNKVFNAWDTKYDEENSDAVYWVDNIKIVKLGPAVLNSTVANGAENVSVTQTQSFEFDSVLKDNAVNYVELYKGNKKVTAVDIAKTSGENGDIITVTPKEALDYSAQYSIKLLADIQNTDGVYVGEDIVYSFTTEKDPNVIVYEDFESYSEGSELNGSWVKTKLINGNTAKVEIDPVTGSKAIKMIKSNDASDTMALDYDLKKNLTEGKYIISYDVRIDTATKYFQSIGETRNSEWSSIYSPRLKGGELHRDNTQFNPKFGYRDQIGYDYATFSHILDIDNSTDELSVYKNGNVLMSNKFEYTKANNNFTYLNFAVSTDNQYHVNAWDAIYAEDGRTTADNNPDGVMYIDNLKIERYTFNPIGLSVSGNNVSIDSSIEVSFNDTVNEESVTKDNFIIEKSQEAVSDYSVSLDKNGRKVKFELAGGLEYNTEYTVKVLKAVASGENTLSKNYEQTFTTEKYPDSEVIMDYNFEDIPLGDFNTTGLIKKIRLESGDKVQIVKDEYGSKALYIERAEENLSSNKSTELSFVLPKTITSGIVKVSQSIRSENYRAGIAQLLSVQDKAWGNTDRSYFHGIYYYAAGNGTYGYNMANMNPNKYLTIEKTINFDTKDYSVDYYIDGTRVYGGSFKLSTVKNFDWLYLTVGKDQNYSIAGTEGAGKYYFDNIKVEHIKAPEIIQSSPIDGAANVNLSNPVTLTSNTALTKASVNKENIKVLKNGSEISDYSVVLNNYKTITVNFDKEENTEYTIKVNGLVAEGDNGVTMSREYSMTFTTGGKLKIEFTKASTHITDNNKFCVTADVTNYAVESGMNIMFAGYDESGRMRYVKSFGDAIAVGEARYEEVVLDKAAKVKAFVWDSLDGMKAVCEPIEIAVPNERTYGIDNLNSDNDITIAFIGGSITEQQQWITPLKTYFNKKYEGKNVNYVVAGVGGTGTRLQQYRVYNDIIAKNPDLVFIDPTINDSGWPYDVDASYENVVRQLMTANHQPSVVRVAFGKADAEAWINANNQHTVIDNYYGIECINAAEYILANLAGEANPNGFVWTANEQYPNAKVLTNDGTHPTVQGGQYIAEYITSQLDGDYSKYVKKLTVQPEAKTALYGKNKYAREISWKEAQMSGNWTVGTRCADKFHDGSIETNKDGASITVSFYGKSIAIYNYGGANGMDIGYSVDGGTLTGKVSSFVNGWDFNQAGATNSISCGSEGYHTVTFTAISKGNPNENLIMGYFLVD